ncbi:MAG: dihydroorotate dehydrogenase electron transfer subunit [Clostridiales bacterium]|nr:dihydroorotate dehydrogenase electron transfer subunit [Clostridiales bacterium]
MGKVIEQGTVIGCNEISSGIFDLRISLPQICSLAKCGQFVEVYPDNGVNLLPRPISICEISEESLRLVFQVVGKGTELFSKLKAGDKIRVLGPCGNGYPEIEAEKYILVGGGIGVPPLLETAKKLALKGNISVYLGFRSGSILTDEFKKLTSEVYVATDDGSEGFKVNVVQLMEEKGAFGDVIFACGPKIMLKFLSEYGLKKGIDTYVSMEERMACGIGACVGCVLKIKDGSGFVNKKVCKDGPVFNSKEVIWE